MEDMDLIILPQQRLVDLNPMNPNFAAAKAKQLGPAGTANLVNAQSLKQNVRRKFENSLAIDFPEPPTSDLSVAISCFETYLGFIADFHLTAIGYGKVT